MTAIVSHQKALQVETLEKLRLINFDTLPGWGGRAGNRVEPAHRGNSELIKQKLYNFVE